MVEEIKKEFEYPAIEIQTFHVGDVITTSDCPEDWGMGEV